MTKDIIIGGKTITFTSNGATPLFYKQFFKKDLMQFTKSDKNEAAMEIAEGAITELAFIMAKQADRADMMHLTMENYIQWLELFNPLDITMKSQEIYLVYVADSVPMEKSKKKAKEKAKE